jgi:hypothetical protein
VVDTVGRVIDTWSGPNCGAPPNRSHRGLFGKRVIKTNALEMLVIATFIRGLSVRDVQATVIGLTSATRPGRTAPSESRQGSSR